MDDFEAAQQKWQGLRRRFVASGCEVEKNEANYLDVYDLASLETRLRRSYWSRLSPLEQYELDARKFFAQYAFPESRVAVSPLDESARGRLAEKLGDVVSHMLPEIVKKSAEKDLPLEAKSPVL